MKKSIFSLATMLMVITSLVLAFVIPSCKKGQETPGGPAKETPAAALIQVKDAASLSQALVIEGAIKKAGEIPAPTTGTYGKMLNLLTSEVILTSGNSFDFELESTGTAKIVYLKIDGVNEYFQVTVDQNGNFVQRADGRTKIRQCCTGDCFEFGPGKGMISTNFTADATVQVFEPPVQAGAPDLSFLNNRNYWTPPKRVKYKCFVTGTGDVYMTLTWNKKGDVDLWLKEPNGNKIYYADRESSTGGKLDYDNTVGFGPENIYYENTAPAGRYEVWVHYYSEREGATDWVVNLKTGSTTGTYRGTLTNNKDSMLVKAFTR